MCWVWLPDKAGFGDCGHLSRNGCCLTRQGGGGEEGMQKKKKKGEAVDERKMKGMKNWE